MQFLTRSLIYFFCFCSSLSIAQTSFKGGEFIDIANIKALHLYHGNMWFLPDSGISRCEFPKGSGQTIGFASSLWISGYDAGSNLKTAAHTYSEFAPVFWPGPLDVSITNSTTAYNSSAMWARIWKINSSTIDSFLSLSSHTLSNTPTAILEWPGKGNPYAKGANGASLVISRDMAPFVDVNADGIYNPLNGDYPLMKGSQMLWWIYNNSSVIYGVTTNTLKLECKAMAYAYKQKTVADNIIFYESTITNLGSQNLDSLRIGVFADIDLPNSFGDDCGIDSSRRLAFNYSSKNSGTTHTFSPIAGITILDFPGDSYHSYGPLGSEMFFTNSNVLPNGNPTTDSDFNNYLNERDLKGTFIEHSGIDSSSQCRLSVAGADRRFVIGTPEYHFIPGNSKHIAYALVAADSADGCPNTNYTTLFQTADSAYKIYWNPKRITPLSAGGTILNPTTLKVYPNPSHDQVFIETAEANDLTIRVYDGLGRLMGVQSNRTSNKITLDIHTLSPGIYSLICQNAKGIQKSIFVKN